MDSFNLLGIKDLLEGVLLSLNFLRPVLHFDVEFLIAGVGILVAP